MWSSRLLIAESLFDKIEAKNSKRLVNSSEHDFVDGSSLMQLLLGQSIIGIARIYA